MSRVDVTIVAYNSASDLAALLPDLTASPWVRSVTVVDHGHDGSAGVAQAAGAATIRDASNPGFGAGQNHARQVTAAPYILMLNPDARPHDDGVRQGLELLDRSPDVAMVQGIIRHAHSGAPERSAGIELTWYHLLGRALGARRLLDIPWISHVARRSTHLKDHAVRIPDAPRLVESLAAVAVLARREALESVDGFDEEFFMYGEDADLGNRLRAAGWRLVTLPVEWADHVEGSSSGSWWDRERLWWGGTMRFAALHLSGSAFIGAISAATVQLLRMFASQPGHWRTASRALVVEPLRTRRRRHRRVQGVMNSGSGTNVHS